MARGRRHRDLLGVLAGVALVAQAFDAAVLMAARRLDEHLAFSGVVEHEALVGDLGGHDGVGGGGANDLAADEGKEYSEHGCGGTSVRGEDSVEHYALQRVKARTLEQGKGLLRDA